MQWRLSIVNEFERLTENITLDTINESRRTSPQWIDDIYLVSDGAVIYPKERIDEEHPCLKDDPIFQNCEEANDAIKIQSLILRIKSFVELDRLDKAKQLINTIRAPLLSFKDDYAKDKHFWIQAGRLLYVQIYPEITSDHQFLSAFISELESINIQDLNQLSLQHNQALEALNIYPIQAQHRHLLRRIETYRELIGRIISLRLSTEQLQIRSGGQQERPFLLAYRKTKQFIISFGVDPEGLISNFITANQQVVIVDSDQNPLPNQRMPESHTLLLAHTPLGVFFPDLQAARFIEPPTENVAHRIKHMTPQLLPILLAGLLGALAIWRSRVADRQQQEFIERQRAFITRVTHEFKTPLAGVQLMAESLQMLPDTSEQAKQFIVRILTETNRLNTRIDEVLQAAKEAELRCVTRIDSEVLLLEIYDLWQPRIQESGGTLRLEISSFLFNGDEELLKDAIGNLLSNTIKYRN